MDESILVIADESEGQDGICSELEHDFTEVICAKSIQNALQIFLSQELVLVILDGNLSECDRYSLLEVMQTMKSIPILVLPSKNSKISNDKHNSDLDKRTVENQSCCLKDNLQMAERVIRLYSQSEGMGECRHTFACGKDLVINPDRHEVLLKGQALKLTRVEFDILLFMAKHPGQVLSREQIYSHVWNEDAIFNVDDVVKAHIKAIRKKLSAADTKYIHTVRGVGYRFQIE